MHCSRRQRREDAVVPEDDGLDRLVVGQHGEYRVAAAGVGDRARDLGTIGLQRVGLLLAAVVDRHLVTGRNETGGHARAHLAQTDETDSHESTFTLVGPG